MTLSEVQRAYSTCLGKLLERVNSTPRYACTLGEGWRTDVMAELNSLPLDIRHRVADAIQGLAPGLSHAIAVSTGMGIAHSVHRLRLAQDLNIFKDGQYTTNPEDYRPFGEWWKQQHPLARWGGDFKDYDHFSFEYGGVK